MRKAIFLTAYNRVNYLQQVLHTWRAVRGLDQWHFVAMIEPSHLQDQIREEFEIFREDLNLTDMEIIVNPQRYGVLHHPWVGFQKLLERDGFDFVVRAEDDLVVSDDILEFFSWAAEEYKDHPEAAVVNAFTFDNGYADEAVLSPGFSPWLWGTWHDPWVNILSPTWDHDYSTYNGHPGNQSGWDWNLNTRIFPEYGLHSVRPKASRANNIGIWGVHGLPENFEQSVSFKPSRFPQLWHEVPYSS